MNADPVMFQLFSKASVGVLDPTLRSWVLQVLIAALPYPARIAERNRALRDASEFLGQELSMAERVRQIREALAALQRSTLPAHPGYGDMNQCLARALLARDVVPDERQLRRILEDLS